jgi:membrane-associated phospholipid phosphatase
MTPARAALIVSAACFALLTLAVAVLDTTSVDASVRDALLAYASPGVLAAMRVINQAGSWKLLLPATLLLLFVFRRARERWWLWVGLMIVAPATEGLLKVIVGRPRPEGVSMGFPSGHATAAAAFFGAVIYFAGDLPPRPRRLVRVAAVLAIVLVALARVMLRAHWPTDAAAGICLGAALASAAMLIAERPRRHSEARAPRSCRR